MTQESAGYLDCRGRMYRFDQASCLWTCSKLDIKAEGKGITFKFVAIPFPGVEQIAGLPGQSWNPNDDEMAMCADVFAEGWVQLRNRNQQVNSAKFKCVSFNAESSRLVVDFTLLLEDEETGRESEVEGAVRCLVR